MTDTDTDWDLDDRITLVDLGERPPLHWVAMVEVSINAARARLPWPEGREIIARLDDALDALHQLRRQLQ
jgi:hypothetical protein